MQFVFTLIAVLGLAYFCLASRVFDWLSVGYAAAVIYFLPGFFGYTHIYDDFESISSSVYFVMVLVLSAIIAAAIALDSRSSDEIVTRRQITLLPETMTILALLGFLGAVLDSNSNLFTSKKLEMLETFTNWHLAWQVGSMAAFIFSFVQRRRSLLITSGISLLFLVYIGKRSPLALAMIGVITLALSYRGRRPLISNARVFCAILGFVVFMFGYKQIYIFVKTGDFHAAYARVTAGDFLNQSVQYSEPFVTQHILNVAVNNDVRVEPWGHAKDVVLASLTIGDKGGEITYGDKVTYHMFGDLGFGIVSNIWAEMYSCAGMWGVCAFCIFFVMVLYYASWWMPILNSRMVAILSCWMPFWAFYIHRNDSYRMLSFFRQFFGLLVLASVLAGILSVLHAWRRIPASTKCHRGCKSYLPQAAGSNSLLKKRAGSRPTGKTPRITTM